MDRFILLLGCLIALLACASIGGKSLCDFYVAARRLRAVRERGDDPRSSVERSYFVAAYWRMVPSFLLLALFTCTFCGWVHGETRSRWWFWLGEVLPLVAALVSTIRYGWFAYLWSHAEAFVARTGTRNRLDMGALHYAKARSLRWASYALLLAAITLYTISTFARKFA